MKAVYFLPKAFIYYSYWDQRHRTEAEMLVSVQLCFMAPLANKIQKDSLTQSSYQLYDSRLERKRELKDSLEEPEFYRILEVEFFEDFHHNPVCTHAAPSTALIPEV